MTEFAPLMPYPSVSIGRYNAHFYTSLQPQVIESWNQVFHKTRQKSLFQHFSWYLAYFDAHNNTCPLGAPLFALITRNDIPIAILPLYVSQHNLGPCRYRVLGLLWNTDMGIRDLCAVEDDNLPALVDELLFTALPKAGIHWDKLEWLDLVAGSKSLSVFSSLSTTRKFCDHHHFSNRLRSFGDEASCLTEIPKSHSTNTKRKRRQLQKMGELTFNALTAPHDILIGLETFIQLENGGRKGSQGTKTSLHHDLTQQQFYKSLFRQNWAGMQPMVTQLCLNGDPIAINLCIRIEETMYILKLCYDEQHNRQSPGNVLLLYMLELFSTDQSLEYINLITGGEWTQRWNPEELMVYHCHAYGRSAKALTIFGCAYVKNRLRVIKRRLLDLLSKRRQ